MMQERNGAEHAAPSSSWLFQDSRRFLADQVMDVVRGMLVQVDDALFKLADKAENNALQSAYFDAMREVRLQREQVEEDFHAMLAGAENPQTTRKSPDPGPALSLLGTEDLEIDLAVHGMARKVEDALGTEAAHLDRRIAEIDRREGAVPAENPIGPQAVCEGFAVACRIIQCDIEITLLILKLFDKHVVSYLPGIFQELNQRLINQGILPNLKSEAVVVHPRPRAAGTAAAVGRADAGEPEEDLFSVLPQLMMRSGAMPAAPGRPGGVILEIPQVISGLTRIQHGEVRDGDVAAAAIDPGLIAGGTVNVVREFRASEMARDMSAVDQMIIDIVAMIFDYVLDDRSLPDSMRALIGRLQIPVLKVAMLDRGFFARRGHPARRLLDLLAEAAAGWNTHQPDDDRLLVVAERIVGAILEEFDDDISVFSRYLDEFEKFLSGEAQQARTHAEEALKVISGREKLQLAKDAATEQVRRRLQSQFCPIPIRKLFENHLHELLVLHYMQSGPDSAAWSDALELMDLLLWSIEPKQQPEEREELLRTLPQLLPRLSRGLTLAALPKDEYDTVFSELSALHAQAVRSRHEPTAAETAAPPAPETSRPGALPAESLALKAMRGAIAKANHEIYSVAQARPQCRGMGTTVVAVLLRDNSAVLGNVGDSRIYRLRDGRLEQLTKDHSLVQELIDKGFFTPEEARDYPNRNVVTRMVGVEESVKPDVQQIETVPGDLFLLCSDGITDMITDARIAAILKESAGNLNQAAFALVAEANTNGGKDNISAILFRILAPFPAAGNPGPPPAGALESVAVTDTGLKRAHNEDSISEQSEHGIMVLADGMGGANAGEVASALAVRCILEQLGVRSGGQAGGRAAATGATLDSFASEMDLDTDTGPGAEDIVLSSSAADATEQPVDDGYMALVRGLQVGDWIAFDPEDGKSMRARLTWVSSATGSFLFTNRRGIKVMEASPHGLAIEFRRGSAKRLEQVPLFDRAVSSLTEKLGGVSRPA